MAQLDPERIPEDRKTAYDAFLADPSDQNEQRLAVLADDRLTARRHSLLCQAHAELRRQANEEATAILQPSLTRIQQVLTQELEGRQEALKAEDLNQWNDDRCIELPPDHRSGGAGIEDREGGRSRSPGRGEVPARTGGLGSGGRRRSAARRA